MSSCVCFIFAFVFWSAILSQAGRMCFGGRLATLWLLSMGIGAAPADAVTVAVGGLGQQAAVHAVFLGNGSGVALDCSDLGVGKDEDGVDGEAVETREYGHHAQEY